MLDEPIAVGVDVFQHPGTVMDKNAEFLTKRPLKVKLICELQNKRYYQIINGTKTRKIYFSFIDKWSFKDHRDND